MLDVREFLNADLLAAGLSPFAPDTAAIAAARVLLARMKELVEQGRGFGFETTLAGKTYGAMLQRMKVNGYRLHLFYLWLPGVELAIERVAHRVREGGHSIPEEVIRQFNLGLHNLFRVYMPLFDSWLLFDNSNLPPRTIASHEAGDTEVLDAEIYERIVTAGQGHGL